MFSHPMAAIMENWWQAHGGRHDDEEWQAYLQDLERLLVTKLDELAAEHTNAGEDGAKRFGMSGVGSCTRKAALKYLGYEPEPFSGSTLMTFHVGHLLECSAIATLRRCGLTIPDTQQVVEIPPMMLSYSDGIITEAPPTTAVPTPCVLSVKTTGYKKSGIVRGKPVRQGFPALPFEGVRRQQPSWWAQAQAEMYALGCRNALIVVVAKDIVQAMRDDPYLMGPGGNGSLTFYVELIEIDDHFIETEMLPIWQQTWDAATDGRPGEPFVYNPEAGRYIRLPKPADVESGWNGPNQEATGTFNPCFGCDMAAACKDALAKAFMRRR